MPLVQVMFEHRILQRAFRKTYQTNQELKTNLFFRVATLVSLFVGFVAINQTFSDHIFVETPTTTCNLDFCNTVALFQRYRRCLVWSHF